MNLEDGEYLNSFSQPNNENSVQFSHSRSALSENSFLYGVGLSASPNTVSRPLETSFNSSLIASTARPGIRSLRASFNAIDNYYRVSCFKSYFVEMFRLFFNSVFLHYLLNIS